jgi:hypothetical protein
MTLESKELTISKKEQILKLMAQKPLTVEEIEDQLRINKNLIWVYISQWKKEGKVVETGDHRNKYKVYKMKEDKPKSTIDTIILKKMIPKFVELGVKGISFENEEIERIKLLYSEIKEVKK